MDNHQSGCDSSEQGIRNDRLANGPIAASSAPGTFSLQYDLRPADYLAALRFHHYDVTARRKRKVPRFLAGVLYMAFGVGAAASLVVFVWLVGRDVGTACVVWLGLCALFVGLQMWRQHRFVGRLPMEMFGHRELVASADGITIRSQSETASWPWRAMERSAVSGSHLLLFDQERLLCLVPKRAFVDTERFCQFAAEVDRQIAKATKRTSAGGAPMSPFAPAAVPGHTAEAEVASLAWAERIRAQHLLAETHLKQSTLLLSGLFIVLCVVFFTVPFNSPASQHATSDAIVHAAMKVLLVVAALASCVLSWGVRGLAAWTRRPLIVLACLSLFLFPLGTIVGLQVLRRLGAGPPPRLLSREYAWAVSQTRHLQFSKKARRTGVLTWIALALIILIVILLLVIAQLPPEFRHQHVK